MVQAHNGSIDFGHDRCLDQPRSNVLGYFKNRNRMFVLLLTAIRKKNCQHGLRRVPNSEG